MTDRQSRFVQEYLVDLNATQAAIRSGYSARGADVQGVRLLGNASVAAAIAEAQAARAARTGITQDRVLQELARIGFADVRDLFEWDEERTCFVPSSELTADQAAAVSAVEAETRTTRHDGVSETTIKLKLKTYDKVAALEKIGKHLGMFVEKVEHSGSIEVPSLNVIVKRAAADAGTP